MEALMFFERRHRILVSGDALWNKGMGIVWPEEAPSAAIAASMETLAAIERLDPAVVIPGHGEPFSDVRASLENVRGRLAAFGADPAKNARHVLKVLFVFALLERDSMPVAEVEAYVSRVPCYRQLLEPFLDIDTRTLATWLLPELERVGAVRIEGGVVRPTMAA
jgi:glyoxylase-like metal-dependent hydrolase (beta-lactamase superfamily II)